MILPTYTSELNDLCHALSLEDLRYSGHLLTWSKGSGQGFLARKVDRALVNYSWMSCFTEAEASCLEPGASDHSPIVIQTGMDMYMLVL